MELDKDDTCSFLYLYNNHFVLGLIPLYMHTLIDVLMAVLCMHRHIRALIFSPFSPRGSKDGWSLN